MYESQSQPFDGCSTTSALPRRFYTNQRIYQREIAWLRENMWFMVGHESQIPRVGDYFLYDFDGDSVILVRDHEGNVRAHHNVCRHRGSRICLETNGSLRAFICPYHAWSYELDGQLRRVPAMPAGFEKSAHGLISCHVRVHCGLMFLSFAETPPDFASYIGCLARELDIQDVQHSKVAKHALFRANANWKLLVQNNLECYHCRPAHPTFCAAHPGSPLGDDVECAKQASYRQLQASVESSDVEKRRRFEAVYTGPDSPYLQRTIRVLIGENCSTESVGGKPVAPLMGQCTYDGMQTAALPSPLSNVVMNPDYVVIYNFTPRSLQHTDVAVTWLVKETAVEGVDFDAEKMAAVWQRTLLEDKVLAENAQLGIRSTAYRPGPYMASEAFVSDFDLWYLRRLMIERTPN